MYRAVIAVTPRPSILDPQGKATQHALHNLGYEEIEEVRVGRHIEVTIDAGSREEAERTAERACEELLANPVTEDYGIEITSLERTTAEE